MLIHFKKIDVPKRAAKRLPSFFSGLSPFDVKDVTAYVFGYQNWAALKEEIGNCNPSLFDEDCTSVEFNARREYQAGRLTEFLASQCIEADAIQIISRWQPSAGHPQEDVKSAEQAKAWRESGNESKLLQLLKNLEAIGRIPTSADLNLILQGLRNASKFTSQLACTYVGPVAIKLVNENDPSSQAIGLRLLEAMVANEDVYARVSLATALARGWGGNHDPKRALDLAKFVLDEIFIEDCSSIEFLTLVAELSMSDAGGPSDRQTALKMLELAAALGHPESAYNAGLFYDDEPGEEMRGVVVPDPAKAHDLYVSALNAGYFRAQVCLNSLVERHLSLRSGK